jgi:hypothetical protein
MGYHDFDDALVPGRPVVAVLCSTPGERDPDRGGFAAYGEFLYRVDDGLVQHMADLERN